MLPAPATIPHGWEPTLIGLPRTRLRFGSTTLTVWLVKLVTQRRPAASTDEHGWAPTRIFASTAGRNGEAWAPAMPARAATIRRAMRRTTTAGWN